MTRRRRSLASLPIALPLVVLLSACLGGDPTPTPLPPCPTSAPTADEAATILVDADRALVTTNKGTFTIELRGDVAPIATANFVALARCGFYAQVSFHRVIPGLVIQAGDPQTRANHDDFAGVGTGGPGYSFTIEPPDPSLGYDPYAVAMANAGGTASNGSQFFVDLADLNGRIARSYTIFGAVVDGTDTIDEIGSLPTNANDVPLDPAIIERIEILSDAAASPSPDA